MQTSIKIIKYWHQSDINRYGESPDVLCQQTATKEEEKVKNSIHEPPNIWVGETILISEISISGRQRRNRRTAGTVECPGKNKDWVKIGRVMLWRIIITVDEWCFMMLVGVRQKCSSRAAVFIVFSQLSCQAEQYNSRQPRPVQFSPTAAHNYRVTLTYHIWRLFWCDYSQPIINISKWNPFTVQMSHWHWQVDTYHLSHISLVLFLTNLRFSREEILQTIMFITTMPGSMEQHNNKISPKLIFRLFAGSRIDEPSLRETWRSWRRTWRRRPRFLWEELQILPVFRGRT